MTTNSGGVADAATDASRVRALLQEIGISQRDAARRLGIDDRSMRYYCAARLPMPSAVVLALRNLALILRNEHGIELLGRGMSLTSDGPATAADLHRNNKALEQANELLMRPLRPCSEEAESESGSLVAQRNDRPRHASTFHLHSIQVLLLAYRARNRAIKEYEDRAERQDSSSILTPDANVAVVLAAASTEAFVNELAEYIGLHRQNAADWHHLSEAVLAAADEIFAAEEAREPITEKYSVAAKALGNPFDAGGLLFQDFVRLVGLRNAIMHIKPARLDAGHSGEQIVDELGARGFAKKRAETFGLPWFDRMQTPSVARWACEAGRNTILAMLERIEVPVDGWDPLEFVRKHFQNHDGFKSETWL